MFKSRKKKQVATNPPVTKDMKPQELSTTYRPLDEIPMARDFRTSVIVPQLSQEMPCPPSIMIHHDGTHRDDSMPPLTKTMLDTTPCLDLVSQSLDTTDGNSHYADLAAWRSQRHHRFSNGLFGGKQRDNAARIIKSKKVESAQKTQETIAVTEDENKHTDTVELGLIDDPVSMQLSPASSSTPSTAYSDDDDDDDETEEDLLDHTIRYEDCDDLSDTDENFFLKDFAAESVEPTSEKARRRRSKACSTRHRSTKAMSRFDLANFARQLHENRLSVMQSRQSHIVLTEEDERELDNLLAQQRIRDTDKETAPFNVPPVPPIPPMPVEEDPLPHQASSTDQDAPGPAVTPVNPRSSIFLEKLFLSEHDLQDHITETCGESLPQEPTEIHSSPVDLAPTDTKVAENDDLVEVPETSLSRVKGVSSLRYPSSRKTENETNQVKRSRSTTETEKVKNVSFLSSLTPSKTIVDEIPEIPEEPSVLERRSIRKSMSTNTFPVPAAAMELSAKIEIDDNDTLVAQTPTSATDLNQSTCKPKSGSKSTTLSSKSWKSTLSLGSPPSKSLSTKLSKQQQQQQQKEHQKQQQSTAAPKEPSRSLGLFNSLRQASRTRSLSGTSPFKGLVRNLSSAGSLRQPSLASTKDSPTMSRAARAVIQHNIEQHEQRRLEKRKTEQTQAKANSTDIQSPRATTSSVADQTKLVEGTTSGPGSSEKAGVRLLSQLLAKAAKSSRRTTKTVNMHHEQAAGPNGKNSRAQVVRRTIIYVQPDSLNFLKNAVANAPPVPSLKTEAAEKTDAPLIGRRRQSNGTDISPKSIASDQSQEYATATKIVRQTSVRKRLVETTESDPQDGPDPASNLSRQGSKKKWRLESMDEPSSTTNPSANEVQDDDSVYDYYRHHHESQYLQGLELREMSDGTVIWGIVKKQGNRKSFFSPQLDNHASDQASHDTKDDKNNKGSTSSHPFSTWTTTSPSRRRFVQEEEEEEEDNEQIEARVLALMGLRPGSLDDHASSLSLNPSSTAAPTTATATATATAALPPPIPRRSPQRQIPNARSTMDHRAKHISTIASRHTATTTDIYYAPEMTLPNLLQMVTNTQGPHGDVEDGSTLPNPKKLSVEEQLDEMMRSFASSSSGEDEDEAS